MRPSLTLMSWRGASESTDVKWKKWSTWWFLMIWWGMMGKTLKSQIQKWNFCMSFKFKCLCRESRCEPRTHLHLPGPGAPDPDSHSCCDPSWAQFAHLLTAKIPGQKYLLESCLSPENVLEYWNIVVIYMFKHFFLLVVKHSYVAWCVACPKFLGCWKTKGSAVSRRSQSLPVGWGGEWRSWLTKGISLTGWWYTYPSEKYEFFSWDDEIPNIYIYI